MECSQALKILYEFLDDELDAACCEELRAHMASCARCRCCVEFEQTMIVYIREQASRETASDAFKDRLRRLIDEL